MKKVMKRVYAIKHLECYEDSHAKIKKLAKDKQMSIRDYIKWWADKESGSPSTA